MRSFCPQVGPAYALISSKPAEEENHQGQPDRDENAKGPEQRG